MKAACHANVRTAQAANQHGQGPALNIAFSGGAVMGLAVAGLGLFGVGALASAIGIWRRYKPSIYDQWLRYGGLFDCSFRARWRRASSPRPRMWVPTWVGKVEAGIPEDDPRNPAVIADNVGDNVGECSWHGCRYL